MRERERDKKTDRVDSSNRLYNVAVTHSVLLSQLSPLFSRLVFTPSFSR